MSAVEEGEFLNGFDGFSNLFDELSNPDCLIPSNFVPGSFVFVFQFPDVFVC